MFLPLGVFKSESRTERAYEQIRVVPTGWHARALCWSVQGERPEHHHAVPRLAGHGNVVITI